MTFRKLTITLLTLFYPFILFANSPAVEVRAIWLTTNWGLDWPTQRTNVEAQKKELTDILDRVKEQNFNLVLFQVRAQGHVLYNSQIETISSLISRSSNFDPLAFAIEECHKRGMECHAWLLTYPMQGAKSTGTGRKRRVVNNNNPDYYKLVDNQWYLDPGRPETHKHILSLTKELVSKYDIDGIHFDYIRYPSNTGKFPDSDTYQKYGNGKNIEDWRRANINKLVFDIYDSVKEIKNWVQVSSATLGKYKELPQSEKSGEGWTAYETVYQDAGYWLKSGKHDLIFPMMYHRDKHFYPFLEDWLKNCGDRIVVPGLGIYQLMSNEQNWSLKTITDQMKHLREKNVQGQAFFRARNILNNVKGISDSINTYYPYPAKLPPLTWLDDTVPNSPINLEVFKDEEGYLHIKWNAPDIDEKYTYNIYMSESDEVDTSDSYNLIEAGLHGNHYTFNVNDGDYALYFTVTASDRYHNESTPASSAFFIFSDLVK